MAASRAGRVGNQELDGERTGPGISSWMGSRACGQSRLLGKSRLKGARRSGPGDAVAARDTGEDLYEEIRLCRAACGEAHMKTILATGELGSLANVYKASMIAMMAGSDFIKTSTGKEVENATFPVGIVMMRAIKEYYWQTGYKVGFKPAGGIRTAKEAITWLMLVKEELGVEWLTPELFRLGASSLLGDIEQQIFYHVTGTYALQHELAMA
ncbi:LOW QUALITY PROTEIN: deoxyribose-phosphate aldolase-like [Catharus ustulatus]|uniref:LOW QUALITY PROTEIN: deoxyribose-phosphate aldolase-like n=1 Tax=Catharus ustulatus TaxID=91951 RepID=UPI001408C8F0|nr:LOW QUALITY PROTEIN: deoxyribose-phosphate aldolase-like [Catharus ustulatus]